MSPRNILVYVDESEHRTAQVGYAAALARVHSANLTGVYVKPGTTMMGMGLDPMPDAQIVVEIQDKIDALAGRAENDFKQCAEPVLPHAKWMEMTGSELSPDDAICAAARSADYVVLRQIVPEDDGPAGPEFTQRVVVDSGRPVIIAPVDATLTPDPRSVMIAWNGSRECVRALYDALPLLIGAEMVTVVSVYSGKWTNEDPKPGHEVVDVLHSHGINANAAPLYGVEDDLVCAALLSAADEVHAEMIVMGAYSRSRLRERVLGGVTPDMFETMTVPVLMSH